MSLTCGWSVVFSGYYHDIAEILLKVALKIITLTLLTSSPTPDYWVNFIHVLLVLLSILTYPFGTFKLFCYPYFANKNHDYRGMHLINHKVLFSTSLIRDDCNDFGSLYVILIHFISCIVICWHIFVKSLHLNDKNS